jgi:5-methyltetrahydropteroyltriglutamate--homocysteine methyltransferase
MVSQSANDPKRIRTDHIGSLVRPVKLKEAFGRFDRGEIHSAELKQTQDEAIRAIIAKQEDLGLLVVTDGEFRRHSF